MTHTNLELWQAILGYGLGSRTVEVQVMGQRIIFTDEPENLEAILSTQFQDFGMRISLTPSSITADAPHRQRRALPQGLV